MAGGSRGPHRFARGRPARQKSLKISRTQVGRDTTAEYEYSRVATVTMEVEPDEAAAEEAGIFGCGICGYNYTTPDLPATRTTQSRTPPIAEDDDGDNEDRHIPSL